MFKLREMKAISLAIVMLFSLQNIASANPDIFNGTNVHTGQNLAVWSQVQEYGVKYKSLMAFADIAQDVFNIQVHTRKLKAFFEDSPLLTADITDRIDWDDVRIIGDKLNIPYDGDKGKCIISLSKAPYRVDEVGVDSFGRFRIADIMINLTWPEDFDDVTGAAEGDVARHEGDKEKRGFFEGLFRGKWKLVGQPGVNDVIREHWKFGRSGKRCKKFEEMDSLFESMSTTEEGIKIVQSIKANVHELYIYDIGRESFVGGVSTHYGIRNRSIHITKKEFDRLEELGKSHLAARIAHEVSEIDDWIDEAEWLMGVGTIAKNRPSGKEIQQEMGF